MDDLSQAAARALACLDLTDLSDDADSAGVEALCRRADTRHGPVAAVCLWPRFVTEARGHLIGTGIRIATVVNFPTGAEPSEDVLALVERAREDGADEIDLVVPYRDLMEGQEETIPALVRRVKEAAGTAPVKAILETGVLGDEALIRKAAERALLGGADFLKTSTGKVPINATPVSGRILLEAIAADAADAGFKAAGGVRSTADAAVYLELADEIMGPDWATPARFRIGASGVLTPLLQTLDGQDSTEAPLPGVEY